MRGWMLGLAMVTVLFGCAEHRAESVGLWRGSGATGGTPGSSVSGLGGSGVAGTPGSTATSLGGSGAAGPLLGADEEPLARTPTPCLDEVAPRDDAVRPVVVSGSAGASGGDGEGEPSTGITVFDRSGSMATGWNTNAEPEGEGTDATLVDKWAAASEALVASIAPVQHRVTIGAISFPLPDGCDVAPLGDERQFAFQPGPDFIAAWEERHGDYPPTGATPLESAFVRVEQALEQACVDGALEQRHYVILMTDGEPNCGTDLEVVEAMAAHWLAHGIATYVFGLPGSEPAQQVLDRIAVAGGTSAIVVPGTPSELAGGMQSVR